MENTKFQPVIELLDRLRKLLLPGSYVKEGSTTCIIDMGHGGILDGRYVTAPDKMYKHSDDFTFYEGVFNRAVGYTLAYEMYKYNQSYILLNTSDHNMLLTKRCRLIEDWGYWAKNTKDSDIYVRSIHGNAHGIHSANGVEVYTSPGQTLSDPLASIEFDALRKLGWRMRTDYRDGDPDKEERFTILTGHKYPAFLDELGFFTNYDQALAMCDPETISMMADFMFKAHMEISNYLK